MYCLMCRTKLDIPITQATTLLRAWCTGCNVWISLSTGEYQPVMSGSELARNVGRTLYPPGWWTNLGTRTRVRSVDTKSNIIREADQDDDDKRRK